MSTTTPEGGSRGSTAADEFESSESESQNDIVDMFGHGDGITEPEGDAPTAPLSRLQRSKKSKS